MNRREFFRFFLIGGLISLVFRGLPKRLRPDKRARFWKRIGKGD